MGELKDPLNTDRGVRHRVAAFLALAAGSAYLTRHCWSVANTSMQEDLGFNNEQFGYLYSAFSLGYLICQVPGGWLGQKFGTRIVMPTLSVLWSALTLVLASLSTLNGMVFARFGYGLCQAGLIPNQAKVVKDWFPASSCGLVSGIITMSMSIGSVVTIALTAYLLQFFDWRVIFRAYAVVGFIWAVAFYSFFRTKPEEHPLVTDAERELIELDSTKTGGGIVKDEEPTDLSWLWSLSLLALCGQLLFKAAGYNLFVTFFPAFLEYAYDLKKSDAGMLTTWPLVGVVFGSILGGWIIDVVYARTQSKYWSRCGVAILSLGLTAVLTLASAWTGSAVQLTAVLAMGAFFSGIGIACPWAAIVDVTGRNAAVGMGIMNSAGCLAGVLISPAVGGLIDRIKEKDGDWNQVIYLHASFYFIAVVCWFFVRPADTLPDETLSDKTLPDKTLPDSTVSDDAI
jgi:MFS family permease